LREQEREKEKEDQKRKRKGNKKYNIVKRYFLKKKTAITSCLK